MYNILLVTILLCYYCFKVDTAATATLSTFRTESLNISQPPNPGNVVEEAIWFLKNHFYKSHLYCDTFWEGLNKKFDKVADQHKYLETILKQFNDQYTRFIPPTQVIFKRQSIRGEIVRTGIKLKRKFKFLDSLLLLRNIFPVKYHINNNNNNNNNNITSTSITNTHAHTHNQHTYGLKVNDGHIQDQHQSLKKKTKDFLRKLLNRLQESDNNIRGLKQSDSNNLNSHLQSDLVHVTPTTTPTQSILSKLVNIHPSRVLSQTLFPITLYYIHQLFHIHSRFTIPWKYAVYASILTATYHLARCVIPIFLPVEILDMETTTSSSSSLLSTHPSISSIYPSASTTTPKPTTTTTTTTKSTTKSTMISSKELYKQDRIIAVDGQSVLGIGINTIYHLLDHGEVGSKVKVLVLRKVFNSLSSSTSSVFRDDENKYSNKDKYNIYQQLDKLKRQFMSKIKDIQNKWNTQYMLVEVEVERNFIMTRNVESILYPIHKTTATTTTTTTTEKLLSSNKSDNSLDKDIAIIPLSQKYHKNSHITKKISTKNTNTDHSSTNSYPHTDIEYTLGYILIKEFTDKTLTEVKEAINQLQTQSIQYYSIPLRGLIFDLQGNPGGPLSAALDTASLFLKKGIPLLQIKAHNTTQILYSTNTASDMKIPLLVLVDYRTASASEIFAMALSENNRAKVAGITNSLGKNIAQAIVRLSDESALSLTVAEFTSPYGNYMGNGVSPDLVLPLYTSTYSDISASPPHKVLLSNIKYNTIKKQWQLESY